MITYYYILCAFLLLLITTFPFFLRKLAEQSGWRKVEKQFLSSQKAKAVKGERLSIRSANIGGFSYRNMLRIISTKKGLFISMPWPFKMAHKSVLIPWKALALKDSGADKNKKCRVDIGRPVLTSMDLKEKDFKKLQAIILRKPRL